MLPTVFEDITRLAQDDGPHPVCVIAYSADFETAHDYLRAVLKNNEKTERTLELTRICLNFNPANYTVWHYRREILKELASELQTELAWSAALGGSNPKNYQLWHHRRALLERVDTMDAEAELAYVAAVLQEDGKNYHAWSHRQWVLRTANAHWPSEMGFLETLIAQDGRNNSAWNQRWFVAHRGSREKLSEEQAALEAAYAILQCKLDPYNESPWRYLIAVLKEAPGLVEEYHTKAVELKSILISAERDPEGCVSLNSARIDMLEIMNTTDSLGHAAILAKSLGQIHDTIRAKYWNLRVKELEAKIQD
jgi:protein farnesyltransferase/geranylgeranyltransferase type-1 subunit alpha